MSWWWLSFADDDGPLGVAIVYAKDIGAAAARAHALGINPGGEVLGYLFPKGDPDAVEERERWGVNRLISNEELLGDGYLKRGEVVDALEGTTNDKGETWEEYEAKTSQLICEDDNRPK